MRLLYPDNPHGIPHTVSLIGPTTQLAWKLDESVNASIAKPRRSAPISMMSYECVALVDECLRHVETS
jgi:hypothetical protein